MAEWRPEEGWDNPHDAICKADRERLSERPARDFSVVTQLHEYERIAYEAGADAMLAAIWKMAKDSPTGKFAFDTRARHIFSEQIGTKIIPDASENPLLAKCESCPPDKIGQSNGKDYCGVCGWLVEPEPVTHGIPNSEARKRMEEEG